MYIGSAIFGVILGLKMGNWLYFLCVFLHNNDICYGYWWECTEKLRHITFVKIVNLVLKNT